MDKIFQVGIALVAYDKMSRVLKSACDQSVKAFTQLQEKIKKTSETLATVGTISYFTGQQMLNSLRKPILAFMELEDASTQLKVTLMKDGGEISELFTEINKKARELGTRLPGTTADFYRMASTLKALGVEEETIIAGALESAAYLGVVLQPFGVSYEQVAEYVAKFREALGIADKDLIKFMDDVQRLAYMGVKVEEMRYAFADLAGTLKPLGLQGLESAREITPLVGMLIKMGKTGRTVGNALADMIKVSMDTSRIQKANEALVEYGITLEFIDEQTGKFKGIHNLIGQLSQLKELPEKVRMEVIKILGGVGEVADVMNIIATEGIEGYNKMVDRMAKQADLQRRVAVQLGTLRNVWEAFTGTLQNTLAIIGESASPLLKGLAEFLNMLTDQIGNFAERHKTLTKIFSMGVVIIGGSLIVFGALGIALSVIMRMAGGAIGGISGFIRFVKFAIPWIQLKTAEIWRLIGAQKLMDSISYHGGFWKTMQYWLYTTKLKILEVLGVFRAWISAQWLAFRTHILTLTGLQNLAKAFGSILVNAIRMATIAIKNFARALFLTPIGLIGLTLAGIAILIIKYWKPISGFFKGLWQGIKEGLKGLEPAWEVFKKASYILIPIIAPLKLIYNLIKWLIKPIDDTGKAAENLGVRFGRAIGQILVFILTMPAKMFEAGARIVNALWQGMMSMINKPLEAMRSITTKIRNFLPFSPAKEGPLKDLHKIKLIETIAQTIKPAPVLLSMSKALEPVKQIIEPAKTILAPIGARATSTITINYTPTINITSTTPSAKEEFLAILKKHQAELLKLVQDAQAKQARLAY